MSIQIHSKVSCLVRRFYGLMLKIISEPLSLKAKNNTLVWICYKKFSELYTLKITDIKKKDLRGLQGIRIDGHS